MAQTDQPMSHHSPSSVEPVNLILNNLRTCLSEVENGTERMSHLVGGGPILPEKPLNPATDSEPDNIIVSVAALLERLQTVNNRVRDTITRIEG